MRDRGTVTWFTDARRRTRTGSRFRVRRFAGSGRRSGFACGAPRTREPQPEPEHPEPSNPTPIEPPDRRTLPSVILKSPAKGGLCGCQARCRARHRSRPRGRRRFGGRPGRHGAAGRARAADRRATRPSCCGSAAICRRWSRAGSSASSSRGSRPSARWSMRCGRRRSIRRITSVVIRPTGTAALWGKVQEVRDAILDFKTLAQADRRLHGVRRRAGVLPRQRLRQGLPDARPRRST